MQNSSPFGDLHIPKRRRTSLGKVRNRNWSSSFSDSHEKEVSLQNDEFEVAQTLGMLATGAAFQQDDPEVQEGESEAFEAATGSESNRYAKREGSHKRRSSSNSDEDWPEKDRRKGTFRAAEPAAGSESEQEIEAGGRRPDSGPRLGPYNTALSGPPAYSNFQQSESSFRGSNAAQQNGLGMRADSFPLLKATFVPGQTLNENHPCKRCASHVYIARYIEYETNRTRQLQQHQQQQQQHQQHQRAMNGFAGAHPVAERVDRASGAFHKPALPVAHDVPNNAHNNHGHLPPASLPHPYLPPQHFPTASLPTPNPAMQVIPPYAHLLAQQQSTFPFLQGYNGPGLHFNEHVAQQQQAAAQALALSGILPPLMQSGFPNSNSLPLKHGPLPQATMAPLMNPQRVKVEAPNQSRHTNGNAMKEDTTATLLRMGFPPQAVGPSGLVDLEKLRSMYPGLLEQPMTGPNPMMDSLKHPPKPLQMPPEQWNNPPKHVKL